MAMQAVQFDRYGAPEVLSIRDVPVPVPGPHQVLVKVRATSVNPHDIAVRSGRLRVISGRAFPKGVGIDFAGEIAEVGQAVAGLGVRDRVWGLLPGVAQLGSGAAAEYVAVDADLIAHSPSNLDFVEAVSVVAGGVTAITALRDKAALRRGDRILIRGATGGVGVSAVQYARGLGAHTTTLSSAKTAALARELGADVVLDYATARPAELDKYDVVFDAVGSELRQYRKLLAPGGRMVSVALGRWPSLVYVFASATFGRRRVRFFSGSPSRQLLTELTNQVEAGAISPVVDEIFSFDEIAAAHAAVQAGGGRGGKRVLRVG